MNILDWFRKKCEVNEQQAFEKKALKWWWETLDSTHRNLLNKEYCGGINVFPDSGCDGSIIDIYKREIKQHTEVGFAHRYTQRMISYRTENTKLCYS